MTAALPMRLLAAIGRAGPAALPAGLVAGLLLPDLASLVRPLLAPLVFAFLAITMVRADVPLVMAELKHPLRLGLLIALGMAALPMALAWLLPLTGLPWAMVQPVVLYALSPPLLAAAMFSLMLGLNYPLALVLSMTATLAAPLMLPWLALPLIGIDLAIGAGELALRLTGLVGGAVVLAVVARRLLGRERIEQARDVISGIFVILMGLFALAVMDIAAVRLWEAPGEVLAVLALATAANLVLQGLVLLAGPLVGWGRAATLGLMTGNRNMGVVVAVTDLPAGSLVGLFFAVAQVPIFVLPVLLRPFYRRLAGTARPDPGSPADG